jgi:hypothetical protein
VVRKKDIQGNSLLPQAFSPRPGESYVSVHWLEYLQPVSTMASSFEALRLFMTSSSHPELKLQKSGRLAAVRVADLQGYRVESRRWSGLFCRHVPRVWNAYRSGQGRLMTDMRFDPHSGLYTVPWQGPESLAVQQFLLSKVVHIEPSKV